MSIQSTIFLASADGLEALVWLIVGILALVSQGVNKWKKNRDLEDIARPPASKPPPAPQPQKRAREYPQQRQGPAPKPAVDMENQLEDFLRQLTNQPPRKPVQQRMAPPPPPPVHRTGTPPPLTRIPGKRPARPQPEPDLPDNMARYAARPAIQPVKDLDYDVDAGRVAKVAPAKSVTNGLQFKIKQIKSTVSSNFSMTSSQKVMQSRFRPQWENRDNLRRAMIGHIILGTPRGLE